MRPIPTATTPPRATTPQASGATVSYLTNDEAAAFLRLSPRTLEKQRVIGGGPRFRKFGRRVLYRFDDLESWSNARAFEMTSDPEYVELRVAAAALR